MNFRVRFSSGLNASSDLSTSPSSNAFEELAARLRRHSNDNALRTEVDSLLREHDAELQAEGFLAVAARQEVVGRIDVAGEIYATVVGAVREGPLQRRAEERLAVLQGGGPLGARIEHLSRHFAQQASDPALLAGMAVGGAVFQTLRLATLSRLAAAPTASLLTRGLGARALSWGAGFAFEVPAFTFATRGINAALGREQDWSRQAVGRELMSAGLTLFLLKSSGASASALTRRLSVNGEAASALTRFTTAALPQTAAFTGILGAHALEAQLGLRPHSDPSHAIVDSLATLLQFHVGGRILRGVTGNSYERHLDLLGQRLETAASFETRPPAAPLLSVPGRSLVPAPVGEGLAILPNSVFMSSNSRPSNRPGPLGVGIESSRPSSRPGPLSEAVEGASGGKVLAHPGHLRDLKSDLDVIEGRLYEIFRGNAKILEHAEYSSPTDSAEATPQNNWAIEARRLSHEMQEISEELQTRLGQDTSGGDLPHYLREIIIEHRTIHSLLDQEIRSERELPESHTLDIHRFVSYYYRAANTLGNFIDHTGPINMTLENTRHARSWLQRGLEGDISAEIEGEIIHPNSPYRRLLNGSFELLPANLRILIIGDENATRTFQLAEQGHQVTHLSNDLSALRTTERRLHFRTQRKRDSGEYAIDFNPSVKFSPETESVDSVHLIEAFFPRVLTELPPRSSQQRQATLTEFLEQHLKGRLTPGGSAFILAHRDEAVEDLANLVLRDPSLELLDLRQRRTHIPILGGAAATMERGEAMVSWLLFRRLAERPQ